jgi:predicted RNA-binding Zn ribbon-like protein
MSRTPAPRVRFGGQLTPGGFLFELSGGHLALDFANTVDNRRAEAKELLTSYPELVRWAGQAGLLDHNAVQSLLQEARRNPTRAKRVLRMAIDLRDSVFSVFSGGPASVAAMRKVETFARAASRHRQLVAAGGAVRWRWIGRGMDQMLWPVADAAVELLTSDRRAKVRECQGETCRWLFMDNSRQGNRRWCDMSVCGNRAKAKRHYAKVAGRGEP